MKKSNKIWIIYSLFPNKKEAVAVSKLLVEKRLAACVNIHEDVTSLFRWKGALEKAQEVAIHVKTQQRHVKNGINEIKRLHSYDVPCIIAYPVAKGLDSFLQWVVQETD